LPLHVTIQYTELNPFLPKGYSESLRHAAAGAAGAGAGAAGACAGAARAGSFYIIFNFGVVMIGILLLKHINFNAEHRHNISTAIIFFINFFLLLFYKNEQNTDFLVRIN